MRTLMHWAAKLYPATWRQRYGAEFDSLLDDVNPTWTHVADVCRGGLAMQLLRGRMISIVTGFGMAGAIVVGTAAAARPDEFASRGTLGVSGDVRDVARQVLSDSAQTEVAKSHGLNANWLRDVEVVAVSPKIVRVSFIDREPARAQRVATDVMARLAGFKGPGSQLLVIDSPGMPNGPVDAHLLGYTSGGFGAGALLGTLIALIRRRA
jgi:hypothetical protein